MKVKVVNVVDQAFTGKDGTNVAAARLVYELDGKQKSLDTYIPPVVTAALAWKPGEEVEIEEYQDKNGKARFKTPQAGGRKGFGGGLSYEDRARLDATLAERMDRRTALMTAQEATEIPARILPLAEEMYQWLRQTADPSRTAGSANEGTGATQSEPPPPASVPSPSSAQAGAEGTKPNDNKTEAGGVVDPSAGTVAPSDVGRPAGPGDDALGRASDPPGPATAEQRTRLLQLYKKPSAAKAKAVELFGYAKQADVLISDLTSAEVEALIIEAAS